MQDQRAIIHESWSGKVFGSVVVLVGHHRSPCCKDMGVLEWHVLMPLDNHVFFPNGFTFCSLQSSDKTMHTWLVVLNIVYFSIYWE